MEELTANQVTATSTILTLMTSPQEKEKRKAQFDEQAKEVRAELGEWLSDLNVYDVLKTRRELKICAKCTGLPCAKCVDKHTVPKIEVDETLQQVNVSRRTCKHQLQARKSLVSQKKFKHSRIPQKYIGKSFEDYEITAENRRAVEWAKELVAEMKPSLYLYGETGCGKTLLASIVAQELLSKGKGVIFGDVPSLLNDIKATFEKGTMVDDGFGYKRSSYEVVMDAIYNCDLLVLDDIGAEKSSDWALETIYTIINTRYNAEKVTIATSNFTPVDLIKHYGGDFKGKRIVSRFNETGKIIFVGSEDRRLRR